MKLDKHDKIVIAICAAILAALYFLLHNSSGNNPLSLGFSDINLPQPSSNVPFYLTYNTNPNFLNGPSLSLPTLTQSSGCETCSLFS